jgi:hypothetical protein
MVQNRPNPVMREGAARSAAGGGKVLKTLEIAGKKRNGSVWKSNPLRPLFTASAGFEDQGHHQMCKHSRRSKSTGILANPATENKALRTDLTSGVDIPSTSLTGRCCVANP